MLVHFKTAVIENKSTGSSKQFTLIFINIKKMPVDKFGRRYDNNKVQENDSSDVSLTQIDDLFLRRDESNTIAGSINMVGNTLTNVSDPVNNHDVANKIYVDENTVVSKSGDTMEGDLNMDGNRITGLPTTTLPESNSNAVSYQQVVNLVRDAELESTGKVNRTGDTMIGDLILSIINDNNRVLVVLTLKSIKLSLSS